MDDVHIVWICGMTLVSFLWLFMRKNDFKWYGAERAVSRRLLSSFCLYYCQSIVIFGVNDTDPLTIT